MRLKLLRAHLRQQEINRGKRPFGLDHPVDAHLS
jgi:hypothetical protein